MVKLHPLKKININEIAKELGLAKSTVSKALNDRDDVSEKTKLRVKQLADNLGYAPNHFAQALNFRKSKLIGVILQSEPQIENFIMISRGIMEELQQHGYMTVFASSEKSRDKEKDIISDFIGRFVDGFIIAPAFDTDAEFINGLIKEREYKFVTIDSYVKEIKAPFIGTDFEKGSFLATKYLLENGHREIGHLGGPPEATGTIERINGYKKALNEFGIKFRSSLIVHAAYNEKEAKEKFKILLKNNPGMTAVHCAGLPMTNGVFSGLEELGMDALKDISIIDYGSSSFVTSLDQKGKEIGKTAVSILLDLFDGHQVPFKTIIAPELIVRSSVQNIK
ncbi:MAG: LacI family DNA-binding transcriptional regulator [Victivallaceae bacterium]|nr:LacI family DNA-binding transcriptional regulator [Victivallaceae bacterium]